MVHSSSVVLLVFGILLICSMVVANASPASTEVKIEHRHHRDGVRNEVHVPKALVRDDDGDGDDDDDDDDDDDRRDGNDRDGRDDRDDRDDRDKKRKKRCNKKNKKKCGKKRENKGRGKKRCRGDDGCDDDR